MIISVVLWFFIIIIFLVLFILIIPYNYYFKYSYDEFLSYEISIKILFFSFVIKKIKDEQYKYFKIFNYKKEIEVKNKREQKQVKEEKEVTEYAKKKIEKENKEDKEGKKSDFPFKLITVDNIKHIFKFIKDILYMIKPDHIDTNLQLGLEEPHHSGTILGYYYSLKGLYPDLPLKLFINWEEEKVAVNGKVTGNIILIQIIMRTLFFILSVRSIRIGWNIYKYYKN